MAMGGRMRVVVVLALVSVVLQAPLGAQDAALRGAISRQLARLTGGEPMLDSVRMADLEGTGSPAAVAIYRVMGPSSGYGGFMVMVKRGAQWTLAGNVTLGHGNITALRERLIEAEELTLGPNDPRCCPSQRKARVFALQRGRLVEVADANVANAPPGGAGGRAGTPGASEPAIAASVRLVRAGGHASRRIVHVLLRLQNTSDRRVVLAMQPATWKLTDDRGNDYSPGYAFGIGMINTPTLDPTFQLQPGAWGDVMLNFDWPANQGKLFGLTYDLSVPVRELHESAPGQWRPGSPQLLQFTRLADGAPVAASGASGGAGAATDACRGRLDCSLSGPIVARLMRSTTSLWGGAPYTRLDVRFENTGSAPTSLCLSPGSPSGMDERGNPLTMLRADGLRGMPRCDPNRMDPSFVINPGATRDASLEFASAGATNSIRGQKATFSFAVRQLEELPGNQVRSGRELVHLFQGVAVGQGARTTVAAGAGGGDGASGAGGSPGSADVTPPANRDSNDRAQPDPCADLTNCYNAGSFTAQLTNVVASREAQERYLRIAVRIRNTGPDQRVLCFSGGTGTAIDDQQHRYQMHFDHRGVRGFGVCDRNLVNPQFVVQPGATRDGSLEFFVGIYTGQEVFGSTFNVSFALDELKLHPGNQVERLGQHVITFDGVDTGQGKDGKKPGLLDALKKSVRKP
jgi:hypothetical protein